MFQVMVKGDGKLAGWAGYKSNEVARFATVEEAKDYVKNTYGLSRPRCGETFGVKFWTYSKNHTVYIQLWPKR